MRAADFLAEFNCAGALNNSNAEAATQVVNLARSEELQIKLPDGFHEVVTVNIVTHLFPLVTENTIRRLPVTALLHEIGQEPVQLRCPRGGGRSEQPPRRQTSADAKIPAVFLNQQVGGGFACAEE